MDFERARRDGESPLWVRLELARHAAAPAVHLMTNTAVTGASYDIDGGRQLLNRDRGTVPGRSRHGP